MRSTTTTTPFVPRRSWKSSPAAAKKPPGAAGSLREGLAETLTVMALKVPPTLGRTLRSTNAIESMIEIFSIRPGHYGGNSGQLRDRVNL